MKKKVLNEIEATIATYNKQIQSSGPSSADMLALGKVMSAYDKLASNRKIRRTRGQKPEDIETIMQNGRKNAYEELCQRARLNDHGND